MSSQYKVFRNFIHSLLLLIIFVANANELKSAKVSYTKLEIKEGSTSMIVDDVMRTARFYQNILGFTVSAYQVTEGGDTQTSDKLPKVGTPHSVSMQLNGFNIQFIQKFVDPNAEPTFKTVEQLEGDETFLIKVRDLDATYQQLKYKVALVQGRHINTRGVEIFHIRDCNDYIIGFESTQTD